MSSSLFHGDLLPGAFATECNSKISRVLAKCRSNIQNVAVMRNVVVVLIYLCKASLAHAVNHGHVKIEAQDIAQAENEYSQYAFNSLEAETSAQVEHLEELLYEFVGNYSIVTRQQIEQYCDKVGLNPTQVQYCIDLLCETTFFGLETEKDHFEFIFTEEKSDVIRTLARKVREITGVERYQINIPFRSYLEIKES